MIVGVNRPQSAQGCDLEELKEHEGVEQVDEEAQVSISEMSRLLKVQGQEGQSLHATGREGQGAAAARDLCEDCTKPAAAWLEEPSDRKDPEEKTFRGGSSG